MFQHIINTSMTAMRNKIIRKMILIFIKLKYQHRKHHGCHFLVKISNILHNTLYLIAMNCLPSPYQLLINSYHGRC